MEPTGTNGRTRHTLSDPPWGLGLVLWWFSRWMARNAVSCGRNDDTGKAFDLLASVVRFPDRHDRNRSCGWFRCRPIRVVGRLEWFCGGHGPGETPGPFPNPEAKAWHGDGTALERVWESSTPPHSFVGGSRRASAPGTPIFYSHGVFSSGRWGIYRRRPAGPREDSSSGWKERDAGRPVGWCFSPVDGGFRTVEGLWTYWLFQ